MSASMLTPIVEQQKSVKEYAKELAALCKENQKIFPGMLKARLNLEEAQPVAAVLKELWKRMQETLVTNEALMKKYDLNLVSRRSFYNKRNELDVGRAVSYLRTVCQQIKQALLQEYIDLRIQVALELYGMTKDELLQAILKYAVRRSDLYELATIKPWHLVNDYIHHRHNVVVYQEVAGSDNWSFQRAEHELERELIDSFERNDITTLDEADYIADLKNQSDIENQ